ncbi:amino acid deaminase/aldolase [Phytoactinopolyspora sp. XMNu-373]|uniref:Amino acid deaminase/aldolase n=2 Tax=Phytoactinopolyspora mesophila TaxID=2650750 RepID=A0A7K3LX96_9ACTN|nr:alanine racemase [Phytoactinopolyspora mesophila]NDL55633.1 amino acid deaminase/aldolase [Phytoactinopolyspora mesophila]
MDAWDANAADLVRHAKGKPIRVVSAAIRNRALLRDILGRDGYQGVLSYTLSEAIWLAGTGICDDALVAYPSADRRAISRLVSDEHLAARVTIMVDDVAHLDLVDAVAAPEARAELRVCLDLDCSWQALRGRLRFGARRSPLRKPDDVARLARAVASRPGFRLVGLMAYESQPADDLWRAKRGRIRRRLARLIQKRGEQRLTARRAAAVEAVRNVADLEFVNAGGSVSITRTADESCVTELSAGSALLGPMQTDIADGFMPRPAAFFALPVVRRPSASVVTVAGGGYVASGTAGEHQLPTPWLPDGLRLARHEGAGQTQTPLRGATAASLAIGDLVWFRHAKAGELAERFDSYHLVRGERLMDTAPTYRGDGKTFM